MATQLTRPEGAHRPRPRRILSAAEIRAAPEVCALCQNWSRETWLQFSHEHDGARVVLEMPLCTSCGDRIEKRLKRAIPLRSMAILPLAGPT